MATIDYYYLLLLLSEDFKNTINEFFGPENVIIVTNFITLSGIEAEIYSKIATDGRAAMLKSKMATIYYYYYLLLLF